jgi:hypothetical protein
MTDQTPTRRQFLKTLAAGAVLATVPVGVGKALAGPRGPHTGPHTGPHSTDEVELPPYTVGQSTVYVRMERLTKVGSGEHDWSWVECKDSDLRRGDFYRLTEENGSACVHLAGDSYPEPEMDDNTRGMPDAKPMRSVEVLVLTTTRDTARRWDGPNAGSKKMIYECLGDSDPLTAPRWERRHWNALQPCDIFRVREADGTLEEGPLAVAVANGDPYIHPDFHTWAVEVLPIEEITVWKETSEGWYTVRDYTVGSGVQWTGGASGEFVRP